MAIGFAAANNGLMRGAVGSSETLAPGGVAENDDDDGAPGLPAGGGGGTT